MLIPSTFSLARYSPMPLQSQAFRGDPKLEAAAVSDAAHITLGARGPHVGKIQQALITLDGARISIDEQYGSATAAAVKAYKTKRGIINQSYQQAADAIVGKMTMASLDQEMLKRERQLPPNPLPPLPPPPPPIPVGAFFGVRAESEIENEEVLSSNPPEFFQFTDVMNQRAALYRFNIPGGIAIPGVFRFTTRFRTFNTNQFFAVETLEFPAEYVTEIDVAENRRDILASFLIINFAPASAFPTAVRMGVHARLKVDPQPPSFTRFSTAGRLEFVRNLPFPPPSI